MEAWQGFKEGLWQKEINVEDFIINNYTEYTGDASFLKGISQKTKNLLDTYEKMHQEEMVEIEPINDSYIFDKYP